MGESHWKSMGVRLWKVAYVGAVACTAFAILYVIFSLFGVAGMKVRDVIVFSPGLAVLFAFLPVVRVGMYIVAGKPIIGWRWL